MNIASLAPIPLADSSESHADHLRDPAIEAVPLSAALAADVRGLDLDRLTPAAIFTLRRIIHTYSVVRLRGYRIDDDRLVSLGRSLGAAALALVARLKGKIYVQKYPELFVVSNIKENGETVGELGDGELFWHTDMGFDDVPPALSLFYAVELPARGGGATGFASMYLAYEQLPAELKVRIEGLRLRHQLSHDAGGRVRPGYEKYATSPVSELPGPDHPIVRTHPETGRRGLYLGRRFGGWIVGLPIEESEALLNELWRQATRPEITWHQEWQPGDMLIWDNRCLLHRRDAFDPADSRRMHRYVVSGSKPF